MVYITIWQIFTKHWHILLAILNQDATCINYLNIKIMENEVKIQEVNPLINRGNF
jgi:hypothetical protein